MERLDEATVEVPGRGRTAAISAAVVAIVVLALVAFLATRSQGSENLTESPIVGDLAPPVTGTTLDGGTFDVDRQRGRWVVVNFFATWCTPCIKEHPELVEFSERHDAPNDATVVSIVVETPEDEARAFFEDNGGGWPVVIDPNGRTALDYGMVKVPETFVVAPDGTVVVRLIGGVTADGLDQVIARYSAGPA